MRTSQSGFFLFNDTATTEIYTLSLHDALPISTSGAETSGSMSVDHPAAQKTEAELVKEEALRRESEALKQRSEEHTSELQSRQYLVCRLLLEKKKYRHPCYALEFDSASLYAHR